jgi:hypothetical protein
MPACCDTSASVQANFSVGGQRTTCDPTWRPMIVYIATIFAVWGGYSSRAGADGASMDEGG